MKFIVTLSFVGLAVEEEFGWLVEAGDGREAVRAVLASPVPARKAVLTNVGVRAVADLEEAEQAYYAAGRHD